MNVFNIPIVTVEDFLTARYLVGYLERDLKDGRPWFQGVGISPNSNPAAVVVHISIDYDCFASQAAAMETVLIAVTTAYLRLAGANMERDRYPLCEVSQRDRENDELERKLMG